jgi:hypothetical protein
MIRELWKNIVASAAVIATIMMLAALYEVLR